MKKLSIILISLLFLMTIVGCQKEVITASLGYEDVDGTSGGVNTEITDKTTLKDLFEDLSAGTEFVYELDDAGNVVSINNKANDENGYWQLTINGEVVEDFTTDISIKDKDDCQLTYIQNKSDTVVGGWQIGEVARQELTDEELTNFEKALENIVGEDYEPVCVLATQVVSGTNYAYLARGTTVTETPKSEFVIIKVYKDLQGNVELSSISSIDVLNIYTKEETQELVGGWNITDTGKAGTLGSEQAQASFDKATSELVGVLYNPIQLLASQLVNGTNYIALARGKVVGQEDHVGLYIITWYADIEGNSTITDISRFDLEKYLQ